MVKKLLLAAAIGSQAVVAFPWVAGHVGEARSPRLNVRQAGSAATCPVNPKHTPAVPISAKYPYCGAIGGIPGYQVCSNNKVPADGDTAHAYEAPGPLDIRGPCPGLNTAANHHFLSHDGITNFTELVDAQQNVYGVGYDLAVLLAVLGVGLDGDPLGTTRLSLGCDASSRTSITGSGTELGLDGHNKFEGDTSLTRNDYFLANGDDFSFNQTLYNMMLTTCAGSCNRQNIALYRAQRYNQSLTTNGNFYYGPKSLLLYGAASFLYTLFPSLGELGTPDPTTMSYFFTKEQLPPNWYSRVDPYSIPDVANEIFAQYALHPVPFGGNTGAPNTFTGIGEWGPYIGKSVLNATTPAGVACLLYQLATELVPSELGGGGSQVPLAFATKWLNPVFEKLVGFAACPLNYNSV